MSEVKEFDLDTIDASDVDLADVALDNALSKLESELEDVNSDEPVKETKVVSEVKSTRKSSRKTPRKKEVVVTEVAEVKTSRKKEVKRGRGRPVVFTKELEKSLVPLIKEYKSATIVYDILNGNGKKNKEIREKFGLVGVTASKPTLLKIAKKNKIKLKVGRPTGGKQESPVKKVA
jgi:hypothetical protein